MKFIRLAYNVELWHEWYFVWYSQMVHIYININIIIKMRELGAVGNVGEMKYSTVHMHDQMAG